MGVAWRTCGWVATDMDVRFLQGIDEAEGGRFGALVHVVLDSRIDIPVCQLAWDNRL